MADFFVTDLSSYFADIAARPFAFGSTDCCTLMADWVMRCGWPDPMADRRGTYLSREEYEVAMASEGGIERSCQHRFAEIGLRETENAGPGDVCLVTVPALGRRGQTTGAIAVTDQLRAVISVDVGLVVARLGIVRAWSVCRG